MEWIKKWLKNEWKGLKRCLWFFGFLFFAYIMLKFMYQQVLIIQLIDQIDVMAEKFGIEEIKYYE